MIPQFPEFKKLELADKEDVEKVTKQFPPYSDFNFTSMWSWDTLEDMRISLLNENLVVMFNDYVTGTPFYSFIGTNDVNGTAKKLLDVSRVLGIEAQLKLIPEETAKLFDTKDFLATEDRDHFDYVYNLQNHITYDGKKLRNKRNQVAYFLKEYPNAEIRVVNLNDKKNQGHILKLFQRWIENKMMDDKFSIVQHKELMVIKRIFDLVKKVDLMCVGIYIHNELHAFFINEMTTSSYALGLIAKADISIPGAYAFLRQKNAEILFSFNKQSLNDEQDLGIENLRQAKMQFRPSNFLKKYTVEPIVPIDTTSVESAILST